MDKIIWDTVKFKIKLFSKYQNLEMPCGFLKNECLSGRSIQTKLASTSSSFCEINKCNTVWKLR